MISANIVSRYCTLLKVLGLPALCFLAMWMPASARSAPFTAGNLAVLRVGDSTATLSSTSTNMFLDEYTLGGVFVQAIAVPATGSNALVVSGSATSEGALSRSPDGRLLCFTGYNTNAGVAGIASSSAQAAARAVAVAPNLTYASAPNFAGGDSFTFRVNDGRLNSATATVSITVKRDFTYQDTDLLLVFRKTGFNDLLFNLGTVSNYLGQANGSMLNVTNFDVARVNANFSNDLSGVKYALMAVTSAGDSPLRAWLSDSDSAGAPTDETSSKWGSQRSKINGVGSQATAYTFPEATNQSLSLPPGNPNSYTYIAGNGGAGDVSTLSGAAPFVVEQDVTTSVRFFELKVSSQIPKPVAQQVGTFTVDINGNVMFAANKVPVAVDDGAVTERNQPLNISAATLLANDSDPDGDPLTVQSVSATSTNGGTVVLSLGTVIYTPVNGSRARIGSLTPSTTDAPARPRRMSKSMSRRPPCPRPIRSSSAGMAAAIGSCSRVCRARATRFNVRST